MNGMTFIIYVIAGLVVFFSAVLAIMLFVVMSLSAR